VSAWLYLGLRPRLLLLLRLLFSFPYCEDGVLLTREAACSHNHVASTLTQESQTRVLDFVRYEIGSQD